MPYVRLTSKRQVTLPKSVLDKFQAQAGDLLEVTFKEGAIELRVARKVLLDLMGIFPVEGPQDFSARAKKLKNSWLRR